MLFQQSFERIIELFATLSFQDKKCETREKSPDNRGSTVVATFLTVNG